MRLGQLNLYVSDLDAGARFYEAALGFIEVERGETFRTLRAGDVTITLFHAHGDQPAPARGSRPGMTADLIVDDFDDVVERIDATGGAVAEVESWSGGRFVLFTDPDGIPWELIEEG